jgi:2-C-methyl-D-erythritol 2,4-cyclodiphosphate synthase
VNPGSLRIGLGHDTHRLEAGRPLVLGGVLIPHDKGPVAHSDGDVVLHAITDALLGAAGLGDIGEWFPDNDPKWQGADSKQFVQAAAAEIRRLGWHITNLDCTIHAQQPKLMTYKAGIRESLADVLDLDVELVNVKAKTGERVGPIGREEAIAADAVVLLVRY